MKFRATLCRSMKEYTWIAIGCVLLAAGLNLFLVPFQLSSGGIGTLGTVLLYFFHFPLWASNLLFNALLFALGFRFLKRDSLIKTAVGILFLSLFLEMTADFGPLVSDRIAATVCGGVIMGIGLGLVIRWDGSTGGSDFAALMLKGRFPHVSVTTILWLMDGVLIALAGILFQNGEVAFYSAVAMWICAKVADPILSFGTSAKALFVMGGNTEKIATVILEQFHRGVTEIYSRGAWSGEEKKTLFCVVTPKETPKVIHEIKEADPFAFVVVTDARQVLGKGFQEWTTLS